MLDGCACGAVPTHYGGTLKGYSAADSKREESIKAGAAIELNAYRFQV